MNQHLLVKMRQLSSPTAMRRSDEGREQDAISFANLGKAQSTRPAHGAQPMSKAIALALPAIGALIWTVRRSGISPKQLNDPKLIRGLLIVKR